MSHAIILAYHGPANYATEPFSWFPGNTILSSLGLSAYPTGIIDRVTGVQSRSAWVNLMNQRNNVPATVEIECTSRSYDPGTRTFNATFDLTALQTLSGEYKYNVIITEDGIVWQQNGSLGGPNYVHDFYGTELCCRYWLPAKRFFGQQLHGCAKFSGYIQYGSVK
jgi:hypothetical protein